MPIDFNPHILFNSNKSIAQKIVHHHFIAENTPAQDTFSKSVTVTDKTLESNYDGIKINKKSFGTIQKTNEEAGASHGENCGFQPRNRGLLR